MGRELPRSQIRGVGGSLLVRPERRPDEWWRGFAARVLFDNGWRAGNGSAVDAEVPLICSSLGIDPAGTLHVRPGESGEQAYMDEVALPRWAVRRSGMGLFVCGHCLEESRHIRLLWRIPAYEVCPKHGCALARICAQCSHAWTPWDVLRGNCPCGAEIGASQHGSEADSAEVLLAGKIWAAALPLSTPGGTSFALALFCWRLLMEVARARRGRDIALRDHRMIEHAAKWLSAEGLEFHVSLAGVEQFLGALKAPIHLAAAATWLDHLKTSEQASSTVLSHLPLSAWREQLRERGAPEQRLRSSGQHPAAAAHSGALLLNQVARSLGMNSSSMAGLVRAAGVEVAEERRKERAYRLVDEDGLRKLNAFRETYAGRTASALVLGVGRTVLRHLRNSGHLKHAYLPSGKFYLKQDINRLLNDLHRHASPWNPSLKLLDLADERLWWLAAPSASCELLEDLRQGTSSVYQRDSGTGLQQFGVPVTVLARLHARSLAAWSKSQGQGQLPLFDVDSTTASA